MKVRVVDSGLDNWYRDHIGETFEVEETKALPVYQYYHVVGKPHTIRADHAEVAVSEQFWMVLRDGSNHTAKRHETYHSAEKEAERLAMKHPGIKFYVLNAITSTQAEVECKFKYTTLCNGLEVCY